MTPFHQTNLATIYCGDALETLSQLPDESVQCCVTSPPYFGLRSYGSGSKAVYSEAHFATFPPDLIRPCILAGSRIGDVVIDPFCGSGTTGQVALETSRKFIGIELNPTYCNLIVNRINVTPGLPL